MERWWRDLHKKMEMYIGVNFAGPLYIKGKDGKMSKCYFAIFHIA